MADANSKGVKRRKRIYREWRFPKIDFGRWHDWFDLIL